MNVSQTRWKYLQKYCVFVKNIVLLQKFRVFNNRTLVMGSNRCINKNMWRRTHWSCLRNIEKENFIPHDLCINENEKDFKVI